MSQENSINIEGAAKMETQCPSCKSARAALYQKLIQIPYYDDFHMIYLYCPDCGYRMTDFANMSSHGFKHFEYVVEDLDDFDTKVVRSSDGVFQIPELGITIEPSISPNTWIRNVEGILLDILEKVEFAKSQLSEPEKIAEAELRLQQINKALKGELQFTLIIEDPNGNSLIIPHNKAKLIERGED